MKYGFVLSVAGLVLENCWIIWKIAKSKQADIRKEVENNRLLYRNAVREKRSIIRRFNPDKPKIISGTVISCLKLHSSQHF